MDIRLCNEKELDTLVDLWCEASLVAHHFIDKNYWQSQAKEMKEKYLPMSETYVLIVEKEIMGFISMVDDYLAALFIERNQQGKGYGKKLLTYMKEQREKIQLKVYQKNSQAVHFYKNNGFSIIEECYDMLTGEKELLMEWKRS